jgi:chitinase
VLQPAQVRRRPFPGTRFEQAIEDGPLHVPAGFLYPDLIKTAHRNGVKVVLAVGGWEQSTGFSPAAAEASSRQRFIQALVAFCTEHGYDGIDLDWEFPSRSDRDHLVALVTELRAALKRASASLTLSLTVPVNDGTQAYHVNALMPQVDWLSVMTYDYHGPWFDHAGHNAPLYTSGNDPDGSVDRSVRHWLGKGVPASKLNIGLPFYGRRYASTGIYTPSTGGEAVDYAAIEGLQAEGWSVGWDPIASAAYLTDTVGTQFISYDDIASMRMKAGYIQSNNLRGAIIWSLGQDYTEGTRQPLLETVGTYLKRGDVPKEAGY